MSTTKKTKNDRTGMQFTRAEILQAIASNDGNETKTCPRCHKSKPAYDADYESDGENDDSGADDFGLRRTKRPTSDGKTKVRVIVQSYCRACRRAHGKKMRKEHAKETKPARKATHKPARNEKAKRPAVSKETVAA